jgi:hypothetical protein
MSEEAFASLSGSIVDDYTIPKHAIDNSQNNFAYLWFKEPRSMKSIKANIHCALTLRISGVFHSLPYWAM